MAADDALVEWLRPRMLGEVINPFPKARHCADPYDDELMEAFCSYLAADAGWTRSNCSSVSNPVAGGARKGISAAMLSGAVWRIPAGHHVSSSGRHSRGGGPVSSLGIRLTTFRWYVAHSRRH